HVDVKKLGRIPDGGGWRAHGRGSVQDLKVQSSRGKAARAGQAPSRGYRYLHHAVDDHSRLVYSEILADEKKHTVAGFWTRARAFFAGIGVSVEAVMTDNGLFRVECGVRHPALQQSAACGVGSSRGCGSRERSACPAR